TAGLSHIRRLEAVGLRRSEPARTRRDTLLHQDQDRDVTVALWHPVRVPVRHPDDGLDTGHTSNAPPSCGAFACREPRSEQMALVELVEYEDAGAEVRAIYDDIMRTRNTDWINNFWKALANDPASLRRTWETLNEIMGPGHLDPLVKEMVYIAVSVTNDCDYCIHSHTASARAKGLSDP